MPSRNAYIIVVAAAVSFACYARADRNRYASPLSEAMNLITFNYLEDVEYRDLYENAMRGMTSGLDPYSSYISPSDYRFLREELDQEFGGIGIMIEFDRETKRLMVMSPLIDTPAARAGVKAGDIILEIEGRSTAEMSFRDAVELIRGKPGDPVRLKILHPGDEQPVDLSIQRAIIPIESVLGDVRRPDGRWDFRLESEPRITYIRLVTFGENTVEELKKVLEGRKLESLVLDLRDNAGGLLSAAVETCDLFLDEGTVVTIRGREGEVRQSYLASAKSLVPKDVPVTVLVNRYSASASEIVAACLQDHGRAKIVGHRTWGKGTVQNIIDLEGGEAALKLTTASYWRPSGKNIHRVKDAGQDDDWGVRPDKGFEVELTDEQADKIRTQRRQRDGLRSPQNASQTSEGKPAAKDGDEAVEDLQLRRAVEYLQGEMGVPAKHAAA